MLRRMKIGGLAGATAGYTFAGGLVGLGVSGFTTFFKWAIPGDHTESNQIMRDGCNMAHYYNPYYKGTCDSQDANIVTRALCKCHTYDDPLSNDSQEADFLESKVMDQYNAAVDREYDQHLADTREFGKLMLTWAVPICAGIGLIGGVIYAAVTYRKQTIQTDAPPQAPSSTSFENSTNKTPLLSSVSETPQTLFARPLSQTNNVGVKENSKEAVAEDALRNV